MTVDPTEVAFSLIAQSAPERQDRLGKFRKEHAVFFEEVTGKPGITLKVKKAYQVQFACKDLQVMWLLGFSLWKSLEAFGPGLAFSIWTGAPFDSVFKQDDKFEDFKRDYKERIEAVMTLIAAKEFDSRGWPDDIPRPVKSRQDLASHEERATYDLVMMAISVIFLHELKHVEFFADPNANIPRAEEELQCDVWARDWFISEVADYTSESGESYEKVYSKRAMALLLVCEFLRLDEQYQHKTGNFSEKYPPLAKRINALYGDINLPDSDNFWFLSACILLAETTRQHKKLSGLAGMSPKQITESLIKVLAP